MRANATGAYDFVGLVAGDYQLEAEAVGFATYREALTISPAQAMTRAVILQVGTLEETITVKDDGGTSAPSLAKRVAAPTAKRCEPSAAGGRILPPVKIADLRPRYPQNLRDQSAGGLVQLQVVIGPDGLVKSVDVTSTPNQEMADAAVDAVRQWEYTPTLLNCVAIDVHMGVLVNFMARQQ
jgi:TonB family protein